MRWLVLANKATRRFLLCHQHRPNGSSNSGYGKGYGTSTTSNGPDSSRWEDNSNNKGNNEKVDLDITSREIIKPTSPTPPHLRTFNLSIIDQFFLDCYTPSILFFPNDGKTSATIVAKHLKKSLSDLLTRFYPFAGELKDDLHIVCNDKGVNFMEARVNQSLKEFLRYPDDEKVRELVPKSPRTGESSIGNYIIGVQVNIFSCGGIGLSTSMTHKIFDGHTIFMFMKEWAATTRGSLEKVFPSFVASQMFPNNPNFNYSWPSNITNTETVSTKRFMFDPNAIATLKDQAVVGTSKRGPTRTEATTAIIWKAVAKASSATRPFGPLSPHALLSYVNLRARASPPFPYESIGNLIRGSLGICYPDSQPDLPKLMGEIRESITNINSDHIDSFKGEKGNRAYYDIVRRLDDIMDITVEGDRFLSVTSVLNNGIYNIDFGWGTPIWFYVMNAGFTRIVYMNDTLKGGVEAAVTLTSDEMEIFESDTELLSYATVNPSPLQLIDN